MAGLKVSILDPKIGKIGFFSPLKCMNTRIRERIFQDTPRRVAKFRENRPIRDVEKSVVGKR